MALGIVLHACVAYSATSLDGLLWPVRDSAPSRVCEVLFWWIHTFRLPLFFFVAGYFSELLFLAQGPVEFARRRVIRILVPYYAAVFSILPINLLIWSAGWVLSKQATWEQVFSPSVPFAPELQDKFFGPAHLWFLMDLAFITLTYGFLRFEWGTTATAAEPARLPAAPPAIRLLLLAAPPAIILWDDPSIFVGHHNSFVPHTVRMAYYGFYFLIGALAFRRRGLLEHCARFPGWHLLTSIPCVLTVLWLVPRQTRGELGPALQCLISLAVALSAWTTLLGLFGLALRTRRAPRGVQYFADASYWLYLCHLPLVGGAQVALHSVALPAAVKMLIVAATTLTIGLISYRLCIRHTFVGRILHGARLREPVTPELGSETSPSVTGSSTAIPRPHVAAEGSERPIVPRD